MTAEKSSRTLRTIFAADVVSYSRHMSEAESETIASLAYHREIIDKLIANFGGRIFTTAGDSVVAEFDSPGAAVRCALEVQENIRALHQKLVELRPLIFRIGVHTGDVLRRGENLIGDAVNIAARLESIAPPGGLIISHDVKYYLEDDIAQIFRFRGCEPLKDISRQIGLFEFGGRPLGGRMRLWRTFRRHHKSIVIALGLIAFLYTFAIYDGVAFLKVGIGYRMAATNTVLPNDPPPGWLTPGQRILIDDGQCSHGFVREISGGNMTLGLSRTERCILRPR